MVFFTPYREYVHGSDHMNGPLLPIPLSYFADTVRWISWPCGSGWRYWTDETASCAGKREGGMFRFQFFCFFLLGSDESWFYQVQFLNIWLFGSFFDCFCYSKLIFWGWRQQWKDKCVRDEYSFFSQEFRKKTNWEGRKGKTKWRWNRKTELDVKGRKIDQKEQVRKIQETIACNGDSDRE